MIGKIIGTVVGSYGNTVIVDVACNNCAIGYEIIMKQADISTLTSGQLITIYIKEIIKEDDDSLYGFLSFEDKSWFEEFTKLSGLGPKTALTILSTYTCEAITEAIMMNNCDFFSSISGIGNKLANRIPIEMKKQVEKINEKIVNFGVLDSKSNVIQSIKQTKKEANGHISAPEKTLLDVDTKKVGTKKQTSAILNDAVEALISLGFAKQYVYEDVFKIIKENSDLSIENIVKKFLQKKDNK